MKRSELKNEYLVATQDIFGLSAVSGFFIIWMVRHQGWQWMERTAVSSICLTDQFADGILFTLQGKTAIVRVWFIGA